MLLHCVEFGEVVLFFSHQMQQQNEQKCNNRRTSNSTHNRDLLASHQRLVEIRAQYDKRFDDRRIFKSSVSTDGHFWSPDTLIPVRFLLYVQHVRASKYDAIHSHCSTVEATLPNHCFIRCVLHDYRLVPRAGR